MDPMLNTTTDQPKKTRSSRGRQRIEIKKLEDESKRQVTFSKRRKGLFKKADELSKLCGVEVGILTVAKSGKLYTTDNVEPVVDRYRAESSSDEQRIDAAAAEFCLDQPIETLPPEKLVEYVVALKEAREKAAIRLEELSIQDSSCLWPFVADQVQKEEYVNQFIAEKENMIEFFNSNIG